MLNTKNNIHKLVFLDLETKANYESFGDLPAKLKLLFNQQYEWLIEQTAHRHYLDAVLTKKKQEAGDHELCFQKAQEEVWKDKGHLHPEFASIICISAGIIQEDFTFRCASFCAESEKDILNGFLANKASFIHQDNSTKAEERKFIVCYNGKSWDIPFLTKRILYNGMNIPAALNLEGLKPWDILHIIDPKESLKFGGFDAPSLEDLCTILGITTALDQFGEDASKLAGLHKAKEFDTIKRYCEADVFALAQAYLNLHRSPQNPTGIHNKLIKL